MVEFGRFGILAYGRPVRLGGRVIDALTALIEASFRADRADRHEHIRRVSIDAGAGSPQPPLMHRQKEIALALSPGLPSVPSTAAVYVLDQSGCVEGPALAQTPTLAPARTLPTGR
jgi:hypothetical protein